MLTTLVANDEKCRREPTYGWMVRRAVAPLVHQSSNPRFDTLVSHKAEYSSVEGDDLVDSEAPVMASSISRPARTIL
jgi:hypothetical protein